MIEEEDIGTNKDKYKNKWVILSLIKDNIKINFNNIIKVKIIINNLIIRIII